MRHTEIRPPLTSTVEPPEDPAVRAAQVVLAVLESPVVRAARVALVVLEKPAEPAGREAPVVSESPGVRVVPENPGVQVGPRPEQKLAVAEQTHVLEAGPAPSRHRSPAEAVALTVSAVINPQRAGAAAALSAEEAGHLPKRPAIAVAAAWEVGVVVEEEEEAKKAGAKKAAEDADAKRDERKKI